MKLCREGLVLDGHVVPLYAGAVHYWRLERSAWRACLEAVKAMGLRLVDVYVPWAVHETAPGELELGGRDPQRDVAAFLRMAHDLGLWAILRPGPHINGELTYFGLPERVVWDPACQARSPKGNPVVLPMLPCMFPVPSYASSAYHDEVKAYFRALGAALSPLAYPHGPIVLVQVDNEGALFFRDGAFDQDYHPDAIAGYRDFLRAKYGTIAELVRAYGGHVTSLLGGAAESSPAGAPVSATVEAAAASATEPQPLRFVNIEPPRRLDVARFEDLVWYLDWVEYQEASLARALGRFAEALSEAGFASLPKSHNFPMAHESTPLNAARLEGAIDLVGFDYYHDASELTRDVVARATTELAVRSDALDVPAFACELGAGFPPYFPPLSEQDSAFTAMVALAYGLRAFNVYMAVERDRWIGAPIDAQGRARPFADFWRKLSATLEATSFHRLRRRAPVRLMMPRIERRLARVLHAFGPVSSALLNVLGRGARESCIEDDLGLGSPLAVEADVFARSFEQALDDRGVPYAVVGGEDRAVVLEDARWVVCVSSGCMSPALSDVLRAARTEGVRVTVGPRLPERDGGMRLLRGRPFSDTDAELVSQCDPASADAAVARAVAALDLPSFAAQPDGVHATVHEDDAGMLRVVFVINPTADDLVARVTLGCQARWEDVLDSSRAGASTGEGTTSTTTSDKGLLELRVRPKSVRMLVRG